ncbi:hypothetical protein CHS0354_039909, partial [Potamilus streckersoni]
TMSTDFSKKQKLLKLLIDGDRDCIGESNRTATGTNTPTYLTSSAESLPEYPGFNLG